MQALSIFESWVVPQLDLEKGSYCNSRIRRRRRKRWNLSDSLGHNCTSSPLCVSSHIENFSCHSYSRSQICDLRCLLFYEASKLRVCLFSKPKIGSVRAAFALEWALEEQSVGNDSIKENSDLLNGIVEGNENEDFNRAQLLEVEKSDLCYSDRGVGDDDDDLDDREREEGTNDGRLGHNESVRIDVRALGRSLHLAKTADDVEEVLRDKVDLPLQVYSSVIRAFGKEKRLESAMALVEWLRRKSKDTNGSLRPNLFIYNSLLGAMKQTGNFDMVENVVNDMTMEGVHHNIVTYNTLMGIYIEQSRESEALNLFEEIKEKGLSPSPASYSTVLYAFRRLEDGFGALKFFTEIKSQYQNGEIGRDAEEDWDNEFAKLENFTIRICYQVMRKWLVRNENLSSDVLRLLTGMDKAGLQTGHAEHERLIWACTHPEHYVVAKELYMKIRERYSEISLSVCNHVIWLMGKAKKWWAALEIYEELLDKGPKPNNMTYELIVSHFNILLTAAKKRGIWRWGVRLLNKMEEKGLKPGSREWNSVLVACSKASETSAAVQIFKRMVARGEKPTVISYGALLSALEKGKLYDEALQVWKHMIKVGIEPNLYAYTIMASIYAGQGKFNIVDSIIREMVSTKIEPTVVTFNAIISGCARNNMGSAAYEWFQRMKSENISPNEVTYEMLIEALANDGKPRLAYELYLRSQNEGLNLSSKAYDAVVQSSQVYGATIDVTTLGPRPPEKKKRVQIRKTLSEFCNIADVPRRSKPFERKEIYSAQTEGIS